MNRPLERNALHLIQDIVRQAMGKRRALRDATVDAFSQRELTILFADLRGFSAIAAAQPPETLMRLLNRCFGAMVDIVARRSGTVDKFIGDAIMAIFDADAAEPRDHARRAVLCAVEMQLAMNELRERHREENLPELYMGIGINTGAVMSGLIGSDAYRAHTIIGKEVNIASRIEALSLRGQVLISEATYAQCGEFLHASEPMDVHVKGKSELVRVREVLGIPSLGRTVPRQDERKSPRAPVQLELEYWPLEGKLVAARPARGTLRNLGYHGLLAELAHPLRPFAELKLAFDLPALGCRATDVYARIISLRDEQGRTLAGLEFTSMPSDTAARLRLFVQMLLQAERRPAG